MGVWDNIGSVEVDDEDDNAITPVIPTPPPTSTSVSSGSVWDVPGSVEEAEPEPEPDPDPGKELAPYGQGYSPPQPDQWAIDNPELNQQAIEEGQARAFEKQQYGLLSDVGNRAGIIMDNVTMGATQKVSGLAEYLQGGEWEVGERRRQAEVAAIEAGIPESLLYKILGGIMTPGVKGRGVFKNAVEGAVMSGAETAVRNPPSQATEGVLDATGGGAVVSGGLNVLGKGIAAPRPEDPPVSTGGRENAGNRVKQAVESDFTALKGTKKAQLESAIEDSDVSFTKKAGPRLEYHIRSNIVDDLASQDVNKGLATNINPEVTPGAWQIMNPDGGVLARASAQYPETMTLRDYDNILRQINAIKPGSAADAAVLPVIRQRFEKFADLAAVKTIDDMPLTVRDGDPKAISEWKKANTEMAGYLSIQNSPKGARRILKTLAEDKDRSGVDLAKLTFGTNAIAEGKSAVGMVDAITEVFGRDSDSFKAYQEGIIEVLGEGTPAQIAKRTARFLDESPELAKKIFDPKQIKQLNKLRSEATIMEEASKAARKAEAGGGKGLDDVIVNSLIGYTLGGPIAAAVAGTMGGKTSSSIIGRHKPLNRAISDGLSVLSTPVARQTGEDVGEVGRSTLEPYIPTNPAQTLGDVLGGPR